MYEVGKSEFFTVVRVKRIIGRDAHNTRKVPEFDVPESILQELFFTERNCIFHYFLQIANK